MSESFAAQTKSGLGALPKQGSLLVDSNASDWVETESDGFLVKSLLEDEHAGISICLMKVDAGAFAPLHAHEDVEQIYVIEGSFYDQEKTYGPGEYIVRAAGAMHSTGSKDGAVIMLIYSPTLS